MKPVTPQEVSDKSRVPEADDSRLLTVKEIAHMLGMSERWIHERTRLREIPCYRFGTALRFDIGETRNWMARWHQTPSGSQENGNGNCSQR